MIDLTGRPGEQRHFVHKRIFRAAKTFVTSGFNPIAAAGGFLASDAPAAFSGPVQRAGGRPCSGARVFDPTTGNCERTSVIASKVAAGRLLAAPPPQAVAVVPTPGIRGHAERLFPGGATGFEVNIPLATGFATGSGGAVMGRYGAALAPIMVPSTRSDCTFGGTVRGMLLGDDGLCYNRGAITNRERKWPKGTKPLLTGGEMRAIRTAGVAARRFGRTGKTLKKVGREFAKC